MKRIPPRAGLSARDESTRLRKEESAQFRAQLPRAIIAIVGAGVLGAVATEVLFRRAFSTRGMFWIGLLFGAIFMAKALFGGAKRSDAWSKGAAGEEKTERWLQKLGPEFLVLHDLAIPGSKANVDHLVIGPTGIFVIDSKNYRWKITENRQGELWSGRYPLARAISNLNWEKAKVATHLGAELTAILCIHGAELPRKNIVKQDVRLAGPRGLLRIVNEGPKKLSPEHVDELAAELKFFADQCPAEISEESEIDFFPEAPPAEQLPDIATAASGKCAHRNSGNWSANDEPPRIGTTSLFSTPPQFCLGSTPKPPASCY